MPSPSRPGRQVSIKDIAARCGVHYVTVSRALHNDPRVRPATAEAIHLAAVELGYDPAAGHAGQRLASRAHGSRVINQVVAMFFPPNFVRSTYFADMFEGIIEVLTPADYTLHIVPTYDPAHPDRKLSELPPALRRGEIDGAIVTYWPHHSQFVIRQLQEAPGFATRPIVSLLDDSSGGTPVLSDDEGGMYTAIRHLLDLGHRHFFHSFGPKENPYAPRARLRGLERAITDFGLSPRECLFHYSQDWTAPLNRRMASPIQEALREHPEITAVIATNDFYAVQAAEVLRAMGRRIPDDISLVGFDDIGELPGPDGENMLATVQVPLEQVGREAASRLLAAIQANGPALPGEVLPTTFIPRGSIAPPRPA